MKKTPDREDKHSSGDLEKKHFVKKCKKSFLKSTINMASTTRGLHKLGLLVRFFIFFLTLAGCGLYEKFVHFFAKSAHIMLVLPQAAQLSIHFFVKENQQCCTSLSDLIKDTLLRD